MAGRLPETVLFEGKELPLWTHAQLSKLSKNNLKQRE